MVKISPFLRTPGPYKFYQTGTVKDAPRSGQSRSARSVENIAAVSESVGEDPGTSIRHRSQQSNIPRSTLHKIVKLDLKFHPYKVQMVQQLKIRDRYQRKVISELALNCLEEDDDFLAKIISSDEAHFHLGGYINKQNCRIWGAENPKIIFEKPLHPERVTVWCGLWVGGIIEPYLFENQAGKAVTVNGERYRNMIEQFFWTEIKDIGVEHMWFQQNDAPCHTSRATFELLRTKFPYRLISCHGDVNWPPRSSDLTPLDFFL